MVGRGRRWVVWQGRGVVVRGGRGMVRSRCWVVWGRFRVVGGGGRSSFYRSSPWWMVHVNLVSMAVG